MAHLYITEQGSSLKKSGDLLVVEKNGATMLEVRLRDVEAVLLFGSVQVTTQACAELLERGIAMSL